MNGFGGHRIEGIGDKHVPWVHNARNTDMVTAIDDEDCMRIMRLFNDKEGKEYLKSVGISNEDVENLVSLGISGISNMLSAIKTAKYYEMDENDFIFTMFTDSMEMYQSRLEEVNAEKGKYSKTQAAVDFGACLMKQTIDYTKELSYYDKKAIHNLKYYTWVEQQGRTVEELNEQWNPEYWTNLFENEVDYFDKMIEEFNSL
jgi:hypothetical protein